MSETSSTPAVEESQNKADDGVRIESIVYPLAILTAIFTWFFAVRYPLWMDETGSYWQISGGFSQIWSRKVAGFAYPYVLWVAKSILGSSVLALRIPSILAMIAATAVIYKTAKDEFGYRAANAATIVFCIHPAVIFAAIDVRPYAFGILMTALAIRWMLRWVKTSSTRDAIIFGVLCAFMLYFRLVFMTILPIFGLYLLIVAIRRTENFRPRWMAALVPFLLLCIPLVGQVLHLFVKPESHVFAEKATIDELALAFAPDFVLALFALLMLGASATKRIAKPMQEKAGAALLALMIGFLPLLVLFSISKFTPLHMFVPRYYLCAVPGIAFCWGMMVSWVDCKWLRSAFCAAIALASLAINFNPTFTAQHGYTWKFAIDAAELNTSKDHAPVLICSGIKETDVEQVGVYGSEDIPQLSYYPLSSPVVGLPYSLTPASRRLIDQQIQQYAAKKQRFVAMGWTPAYPVLRYMIEKSDGVYEAHRVGVFDNVAVVEFRPKP